MENGEGTVESGEEDSRRAAEAQREQEEWIAGLATAAGVPVERMAAEVWEGRKRWGRGRVEDSRNEERTTENAERAREVGVMGNARKLGLGRRAALFDVMREVEAEVLASAAREGVMAREPGVSLGALRIATDLDHAVMMGDWVDVRRVAIHMAVEVIRLAGEAGKRE